MFWSETGINNKICVSNFAFYGYEGIRRKLGIYKRRGVLEGFCLLLFSVEFKRFNPFQNEKR